MINNLVKRVVIIGIIVFLCGIVASFILGYNVFAGIKTSKYSEEVITLDSAESVRAEIDIKVGELTVKGGSQELMEGTFDSDFNREPQITYKESNNIGDLRVIEKGNGFIDE